MRGRQRQYSTVSPSNLARELQERDRELEELLSRDVPTWPVVEYLAGSATLKHGRLYVARAMATAQTWSLKLPLSNNTTAGTTFCLIKTSGAGTLRLTGPQAAVSVTAAGAGLYIADGLGRWWRA